MIVFIPAQDSNGLLYLNPENAQLEIVTQEIEAWPRIMLHIASMLTERRHTQKSLLGKLPIISNLILRQTDKKIARYLRKINSMLSRYGICIYHPKDSLYRGIDISMRLVDIE